MSSISFVDFTLDLKELNVFISIQIFRDTILRKSSIKINYTARFYEMKLCTMTNSNDR